MLVFKIHVADMNLPKQIVFNMRAVIFPGKTLFSDTNVRTCTGKFFTVIRDRFQEIFPADYTEMMKTYQQITSKLGQVSSSPSSSFVTLNDGNGVGSGSNTHGF